MAQTRPSDSWRCQHPSEILSDQWRRWLDSSTQPSPYLLPEWGLFWERVWPQTRAEVWSAITEPACAALAVRRRRVGLEWVFAQPMGTPGGWLGTMPSEHDDSTLTRSLLSALADGKVAQVAASLGTVAYDMQGWKTTELKSSAWVLDLSDPAEPELRLNLSASHRRNIQKGAQHEPVIAAIEDSDALARMLAGWPERTGWRSRVVLNSTTAPIFVSVFSAATAMRWRTAWIADKPVATTLWLVLHDRAVYVDGAFVRDENYTGVNHKLIEHVLTELCHEGVRHFDFGAGPGGVSSDGLTSFKEGWGASPIPRTEIVYRRAWFHRLRRLY